MQKIMPCLWYDNEAEEAAKLYVSVFKNSKLGTITHYTKSAEGVSGKAAGTVLTVSFQIEGQDFLAMNGGPQFKFSKAISFIVDCETQEEVDELWSKLTANGGKEGPCGWLKDKFGLSWQITPRILTELISDPDPKKADAVMAAMLKMNKIDIKAIQEVYDAA